MSAVLFGIVALAICFALSAVAALAWSVRTGQMRNYRQGAASIFDAEEPVGRPPDAVPAERER